MKSDDLYDLIGRVDDKYVAELYEDMAQAEQESNKPRHSGVWKKWVSMAACLALVMAGGFGLYRSHNASTLPEVTLEPAPVEEEKFSTVILDVNPSIQLDISDSGTVKNVSALNDDAKALLGDKDYSKMSCDACLGDIVRKLNAEDYLTKMKNSILVTVVDSDENNGEIVKDRVVEAVESSAESCGFSASVLSQVITDETEYEPVSEEYGISVGKSALIEHILQTNDAHNISELAELNIHSLNQIMEYINSEAAERIGSVSGTISDSISSELGLENMDDTETFDLAIAMAGAYEKLCEISPSIDASTYIDYVYSLKQGFEDGQKTWTIVAENSKDSSLPSVSVKLGKDIISDSLAQAGSALADDTMKIACSIFGLVKDTTSSAVTSFLPK